MFKSIFTGSIRQRLLTLTTIVLTLVIAGLSLITIWVQHEQLTSLSASVLTSVEKSNQDIKQSIEKLSLDVDTYLAEMVEATIKMLSEKSQQGMADETFFQQMKTALRRELEQSLRENSNALANLLASVAPQAILSNDFIGLINYTKSACQNPDIVYAIFLKPNNKPLTRYIDRKRVSEKYFYLLSSQSTNHYPNHCNLN